MEFTQYSCPVCDKRFVSGDDVVVCPECGAPHHRECYEQLGHCFYEDRHAQGFSFEQTQADAQQEDSAADEAAQYVRCPRCGTENAKTDFYCSKCGMPLNAQDMNRQAPPFQNQQARPGQGIPFGFGAAGTPAYDPMMGLSPDEEIASGVTAAEASKFVGKNTPYFLAVFKRLRQFGSGKFSFSAFLFSGAYFLYRKMYLPGIIVIALMIGLTVGSAYLMMSGDWISNYNALLSNVQKGNAVNMFSAQGASLLLPALLSGLRFVIMLICGFTANRAYYRHMEKTVGEIKQNEAEADVTRTIEAKGGVNLPMAVGFFAAFIIIYEISNFLINSQTFLS